MANNPYYQDNSSQPPNYGTGYPPYQYPQAQPGGYPPAYNQQSYTDYEPASEYNRQPPYAPTAPLTAAPMAAQQQQQPMMQPIVIQQQPAAQQADPRPNVVFIGHTSSGPGCFCTCLKAIFDLIWTIFLFVLFVILVILGIMFLQKYIN